MLRALVLWHQFQWLNQDLLWLEPTEWCGKLRSLNHTLEIGNFEYYNFNCELKNLFMTLLVGGSNLSKRIVKKNFNQLYKILMKFWQFWPFQFDNGDSVGNFFAKRVKLSTQFFDKNVIARATFWKNIFIFGPFYKKCVKWRLSEMPIKSTREHSRPAKTLNFFSQPTIPEIIKYQKKKW